MNYIKIYNQLIEKGKNRKFEIGTYYETHHIIPKCLNGTDESSNLVNLTPEEHYVAHQILVKIYPRNISILKAAVMMQMGRPNNKLYGWLRRRFSIAQSIRMKTFGPTKGKRWISNENEVKLVEKDIAEESVSSGNYVYGKVANRDSCGHLVIKECLPCRNRKRKAYDKKKDNARILALELFEEFKNSDCKSVCQFAIIKGTTQPRLSILWKRYVPEYSLNRKHGKGFLV